MVLYGDGTFSLWSLDTFDILQAFELEDDTISNFDFHPHNKVIILGSSNGDISLWTTQTNLYEKVFSKEMTSNSIVSIVCMRFNGTDDRIIFCDDGRNVSNLEVEFKDQ